MEVSEGGREKDAAKAKATAKGPPLLHYCICSVPGPQLVGSTLCSVGALPNSMRSAAKAQLRGLHSFCILNLIHQLTETKVKLFPWALPLSVLVPSLQDNFRVTNLLVS